MRTKTLLYMILVLSLIFNQMALVFAHDNSTHNDSHHGERPNQCADVLEAIEPCESRTHTERHCCLSSPLHCNQLVYIVCLASFNVADLTLSPSPISDSNPFRSRTLDVELRPPKTALPFL